MCLLNRGFWGTIMTARMQFHMMPRTEQGEELRLPHGLYILADIGYPEQYPLLTPWRETAIAGRPQREVFNLKLRRVKPFPF